MTFDKRAVLLFIQGLYKVSHFNFAIEIYRKRIL